MKTGRFATRAELADFVWSRWLHSASSQTDIARAARVSAAVVSHILSKGLPMVHEDDLVPGTTLKHTKGTEYTVLANKLKMRDPVSSVWRNAIRYRANETGEEFVRAIGDFENFTLVQSVLRLEQPHPDAGERATLDEIVKASQLAVIVCPAASRWISTRDRSPQPGDEIVKRWKNGNMWTGPYAVTETFDWWLALPPLGPQRVAVIAAVTRYHDEVMYQPLARVLDGTISLGRPLLDSAYITGDNRSA